MRTRRIRTGFHRIGLVIAILIAVPCVGAIVTGVLIAMGWVPEAWNWKTTRPSDGMPIVGGGAAFLVVALIGYLAAWTLGWIIAGFAGDEENSN